MYNSGTAVICAAAALPTFPTKLFHTTYTTWYCCTEVPGTARRDSKAGPGWISYLRMGAFYANFSIITTPEFLISCKCQPDFLIARFLIIYSIIGVLYH